VYFVYACIKIRLEIALIKPFQLTVAMHNRFSFPLKFFPVVEKILRLHEQEVALQIPVNLMQNVIYGERKDAAPSQNPSFKLKSHRQITQKKWDRVG
jgi:hypothetical protein